jgi:hypothetical protein
MPDPIPVAGPVELIDGKLILRIPLDMGGVALAALALGIGTVDGEHLNVVVQPWLAEKLRIGPDSMVRVSVDTANGNFTIARSAATDRPSKQHRDYWILLSGQTRATKWLAALNAIAAAAAAAVLTISWLEYLSAASDRKRLTGVACLAAALFALTAVAHWRRWPFRWLIQALAIALPLVIVLLSLT